MFVQQVSTILLSLAIFVFMSSNSCQAAYNYHVCSGKSNDTATTTYLTNLDSSLNSLSSKAGSETFYNDLSNGVYSLFLCIGYVPTSTCQTCVRNASQVIRDRCGANKSAVIWYDECILRYSDTGFFGTAEVNTIVMMSNANNDSAPDGINYGARGLMNTLIARVPDSAKMLDTDDIANGNRKEYGLGQCTRDISSASCRFCLGKLYDQVPSCCESRSGWRLFSPSCYMRYEQYQFYDEPQSAPPPSSIPGAPQPDSTAGGEKGSDNKTKIVIIAVSASVAVLVAVLGFWYGYRYLRKKKEQTGEAMSEEILLQNFRGTKHPELGSEVLEVDEDQSGEMLSFSLSAIQTATDNFSDANKLGQGGFGPVYKGKLSNGKEIAVKRLSLRSSQGEEEFRNEVMLIIKLQHKNLVRLLGYCLQRNEKLLVYEYMANTSLDAFLFDPLRSKELDWAKRANIILGTARGILYLHEDSRLKIIHRDLKASNVLLDDEMNPKISDFGTARIFDGNQIEASTQRVVGTYGYMAPEYAMEGVFSIKSDVYSFGMLMLEIISGKKNRGVYQSEPGQSLLLYAWRLWKEDRGVELIDSNVSDTCPVNEVLRWIHIVLLCVQDDPGERPTMSTVVLMLGSQAIELPQPATPLYAVGRYATMSDLSTHSRTGTGFLSTDTQTSASVSSKEKD